MGAQPREVPGTGVSGCNRVQRREHTVPDEGIRGS